MGSTSQPSSRLAMLATVALFALLLVLGVLQYRWAGELERAESNRLRLGLTSATERFAAEFDRELTRAWLYFLEPGAGDREMRLVHLLEAWEETAPYPGMVRDVLIWQVDGAGNPRGRVLAPGDTAFHDWEVEPEVENWLRDRASTTAASFPLRRPASPSFLEPRLVALVTPALDSKPRFGGPSPGWRPGSGGEVVVRLDRDFLAQELFPRLAARYFWEGDASLYRFGVLDAGEDADSERPASFLFRSDEEFSYADVAHADAQARLFRILPPESLQDLSREVLVARLVGRSPAERTEGWSAERRQWGRHLGPLLAGAARTGDGGAWRLAVRHRAGSLAAAVAQHRQRNLALSGGVLALLAAVVGLLVLSSRRAQELAARRVEFVAGVSHELRTPLAAIRSLGQNLADGIVAEPDAVREYGGLIEEQSGRLTGMVEQVLTYSGSLAGKTIHERRSLAIGDVAREALDRCRPLLTAAGVAPEVEIHSPLAAIVGDRQALRGAIGNLIANAAKFGGQGGWVGLRVTPEGEAGVRIEVADRGPGIDADERDQIFEPFYRGHRARRSQTPGSGLGLSLARQVAAAHDGRIEVGDGAEGGSIFSLVLPGTKSDE